MTSDVYSSPMGDETRTVETHIKFRRGPSDLWAVRNPVLYEGEPGIESDTGSFKIGDGATPWADLPYYMSSDEVATLVQQLIDASPGGGGGTGGVTSQELIDHINSLEPHPNYDDGTSFLLRYQNAKV